MNRIDRISAILIQLQSKPIVKAHEIAERFDISLRTVYRDIKALEEAGVPIGAEAGKGYYLVEGYHLPPVMFTKEEAASLLVASKLIEKNTDKTLSAYHKSALYKIQSVLKKSDKEYLGMLDDSIYAMKYTAPSQKDFPNNFIVDIMSALAGGNILKIDYYATYNKLETKNRSIEPIGLCHYSLNWHLIGFCLERNDYRDFRVDRIKKLKILNEKVNLNNKISLASYFEKRFETDDLFQVTLKVHEPLASEIQNTKYYYGFFEQKTDIDGKLLMKFATNSLLYISKWILTLGKHMEIISPKTLKEQVTGLCKELNKIYS